MDRIISKASGVKKSLRFAAADSISSLMEVPMATVGLAFMLASSPLNTRKRSRHS